ncbi:MAG: YraN family protein [Candidatus Paceibacterota bacterium]|jgi:putative endonuclease
MKKFTSVQQKTGELGEAIACRFLKRRSFEIIERNYTQKWGEIDIVARRDGITRFIEVKSVSCENFEPMSPNADRYRPEDQAHVRKLKRISRTIQTYLANDEVGEWKFDLICVYINHARKVARVKMLVDLVL